MTQPDPIPQPDLLDLKERIICMRRAFYKGDATLDDLYRAADEYLAALRAYRVRTRKRFTIPSRSYIIRAF